MSCNCGKNKGRQTLPAGFGRPAPKDQLTPKTGSESGTRQRFDLQRPDGKTQTFGSRLEAQAARVRAGGGTIRAR